jgi:iron(III) transport system permease protein
LPAAVRQRAHWADRIGHGALAVAAAALVLFLAFPLGAILVKAVENAAGDYVGLANFISYLRTPPCCSRSSTRSGCRSRSPPSRAARLRLRLRAGAQLHPMKGTFRTIALVPLLAPTLLSAISLIYWFGNQGAAKGLLDWLGVDSIYGAPGIVVAECFAVFPHALMILVSALTLADARLYEAADALGTTTTRKFLTITLPGAKYGLISAALVSFTLVMTDFGIPKVIGGNFNMLATDVFKLVIGQQDFQNGAVVGLLLLTPAVLTFGIDWLVQRKQTQTLSARAVPYRAKRAPGFDAAMLAYALGIGALMLAMLGMAVFASFATFWPYNLALTLRHYTTGLVDAEVGSALWNSLRLAMGTAVLGTVVVFTGAYLVEKIRGLGPLAPLTRLLAMVPMAVPGLVLGLGYIFFFNAPGNPLNGLYQTMALLVVCTVVHFYTTGHLAAATALRALDGEFESVSASLKVPFWRTFRRVTLPMCTPTLLAIARYFFVNAMTTISAVVFLYSPETKVASIAILNLDEAGENGAAAACAILITAAAAAVTLLFTAAGAWVERRTEAWRGT